IETSVNTGKYRLQAPTAINANAIVDDIIQTLDEDTLTAELEACIAPSVGLGTDSQPNITDLTPIDDDISSTISVIDETPKLKVIKESKVKSAELGDYVSYTINVKND